MQRRSASSLRGFTLTELLVAVGVLIVVILATARIFGTVTKVTSAGEANADMLQTAQAIERQLRNDLARISTDGFFLIQGVEVENDVNGSGAPLLNSALPASATHGASSKAGTGGNTTHVLPAYCAKSLFPV